ncbi:glutathione ABC transporter substrate-binding protein [Brevibacillus choshinensis]|uniref:Glutathione ABC transporter substrate-binding protein n=1 Tax=Brevibacillus choshinensis TaxID=54911 RepID=A0ABX7FRI6_BRECH|nr:glutathione ABC transporter substrate-binding protein [Brevibacillus choshinensis]QRG67615.1 glutathione ABC transporter substrate-binding protein [Brevibacillus choshinensis]
MKKGRGLQIGLSCILLAGMLAACSAPAEKPKETAATGSGAPAATPPSSTPPAAAQTEKQAEAKTITLAMEAEPISMDPQNVTDGNSISVQSTMYEGLLTFTDKMEPVPLLATEYKFNENATELTFTLREGVTFHDGSPFNADVVKANLDFVLDEKNGLARRNFFSFIKEVVVKDPTHVTIVATSPNSTMLSYLAHPAASMKSLEVIKKKKADPNFNLDRNPVGTGPYKFAEWKDNQYVKVVPFENYWNKDLKAKAESIVYKPVIEASTRINMLKAGETDIVTKLPTLNAKEIASDSKFNVFTGPSLNVYYVGINMREKKYQDKKVRQAMNYAINKDELIAGVLDGYGKVADSPIAPNTYGYAQQKVYEYNPDLAKKMLAEAGVKDGFEATLWTRNSSEFIAIAENVAMQLGKVGIKAKVQAFESGTLFDMLDNNKGTDLWIGRWSPGTGEVDYGIRPNFHTKSFGPANNNSGFYSNPQVDKLLDDAISTANKEESLKKYAEVQKIIVEDAPWVFLHVPENIVAKTSSVSNVMVLPSDTVIVDNAEKK